VGKAQDKKNNLSLEEKHNIEFSAGGVVYKNLKLKTKNSKVVWLVTKSTPSYEYPKPVWRLPKGWLDDKNGGVLPGTLASGEKKANQTQTCDAALREVKEEAGIKAKIVQKVGTERFFYFNKNKERVLKFVTFYLMEWVSDLKEGPSFETSEIAWLPFDKALGKLTHSGEKKILKKAKAILDSGIQQSLV
jgi:8-oxo-dGTP pyrophosphatase MutT (NUDIX family)